MVHLKPLAIGQFIQKCLSHLRLLCGGIATEYDVKGSLNLRVGIISYFFANALEQRTRAFAKVVAVYEAQRLRGLGRSEAHGTTRINIREIELGKDGIHQRPF